MNRAQRLDATFIALADPTRRSILARLRRGEATVAELARPFAMSQAAVSKHLKILERAGLVEVGQAGASRPRRLHPQPLGEAAGWIEEYRALWEGNFVRLDELLNELQAAPESSRPKPRRRRAKQ